MRRCIRCSNEISFKRGFGDTRFDVDIVFDEDPGPSRTINEVYLCGDCAKGLTAFNVYQYELNPETQQESYKLAEESSSETYPIDLSNPWDQEPFP